MTKLIAAVLAAIIAVPLMAGSADAYVRKGDGGTTVITTNRNTNVTLRDRTPQAGTALVFLQKKAGPRKCRVNKVIFTRAGRKFYVGPFEKWARTYARAGAWRFPNNGRRDRAIQVTIRTNGRCVVGVVIK